MTGQVPNFEDMQVVDSDGNFTPAWKNIMSGLFSFVQQNFSQEGLVVPQQTTANIGTLTTMKSVGVILYDSDTDTFKACIKTSPTTSVFKTINLI
jgi:hypothetical protein